MMRKMRHSFQTEQWLPYPREKVFTFFANPANLPPLMPAWQKAKVERTNLVAPLETTATQVVAGKGSVITVSFRPIPGVPWRLEWDAYIEEFRWNEFFCDEQRRGPFRFFRHCHRIRDERNGTTVRDEVEYELPFGPLGDVANALVVSRQIRGLFQHRQTTLLQILRNSGNA
jgi:ligand-binding SRPBCC domain-containing protein